MSVSTPFEQWPVEADMGAGRARKRERKRKRLDKRYMADRIVRQVGKKASRGIVAVEGER